ncbi:hypothetical protein ACFL6B_03795 [Thermodesulfobacteriota bacterium]
MPDILGVPFKQAIFIITINTLLAIFWFPDEDSQLRASFVFNFLSFLIVKLIGAWIVIIGLLILSVITSPGFVRSNSSTSSRNRRTYSRNMNTDATNNSKSLRRVKPIPDNPNK